MFIFHHNAEYSCLQCMPLFVSPELSSVRDYVITHSVRSMYVVRSMCMYVVICKIDHCIHIHWCIVMGLGHNDPWVESHMWPQQTWGQRSSRGQWPLVQVFGKKGQCIHILWCIFKSNITMIAKVCDCESRRDSWFENRLVVYLKYFGTLAKQLTLYSYINPMISISTCILFYFQPYMSQISWVCTFESVLTDHKSSLLILQSRTRNAHAPYIYTCTHLPQNINKITKLLFLLWKMCMQIQINQINQSINQSANQSII